MTTESALALRMKQDIAEAFALIVGIYDVTSVTDDTVTIQTSRGPRIVAKIINARINAGDQALIVRVGGSLVAVGAIGTDSIDGPATIEIEDVDGLSERILPPGGATGAHLAKSSGTDYDVAWVVDPTTGTIYGISEVTSFTPSTWTTTTSMPTAGWPIDVFNTPALEDDIEYAIILTTYVEASGSGANTGKLYVSIDGSTTTSPNIVVEGGVDSPKIQVHAATRTGTGATIPIAIRWQYVSGTSTTPTWAKTLVTLIPKSSIGGGGGGGGSSTWGSITGTIGSQSDLAAQSTADRDRANHTGVQSADTLTDGSTNHVFTAADDTKLATIETSADVTDAANVDAAGAVMNADTSTASMSFVVDEDAMTSNSATKVPTQQSVKAYVDNDEHLGAGTTSVALGSSASTTGTDGVAVGRAAVANTSAVAIGADSTASTPNGVAIGISALASATDGIAIGNDADAIASNTISIGPYSDAKGAGSVVLGYLAYANTSMTDALVMGREAGVSAIQGIAFGRGSYVTSGSDNGIAVGRDAGVGSSSPRSIAIGKDATIPASTPDLAIIKINTLRIVRSNSTGATYLDLYSPDGTIGQIAVTDADGITVNGAAIGGGAGSAAWGSISGSIGSQADLAAQSTADRARANHTGTQSADTIVDGTTNHVFTAADDTKLTGIATSATANSADATLLARANHTGTQSADTITDGSTNKVITSSMLVNLKRAGAQGRIDGYGSIVLAGSYGLLIAPYAATITGVYMYTDVNTNLTMDIWKAAAGTMPTVANKITASAPVALSAAKYVNWTTLTGWTTSVALGDAIVFNLATNSAATWIAFLVVMEKAL